MKKGDGALNKSDRVLVLLYRLLMGERIRKQSFMEEFSVGRRSFDRYVAAVRLMLAETFAPHELCYDANSNEYYLTGVKQAAYRGIHILPLALLMFESHALSMNDILEILERLIAILPQKEQQILSNAIRNAGKEYESVTTDSQLKLIWDLNFVINRKQKIRLWYGENANALESRTMLPEKLSYSDHKLVLEAWEEGTTSPTLHTYPLCHIRSFELSRL